MNMSKMLILFSLVLFGGIGALAYLKDSPDSQEATEVVEIELTLDEPELVAPVKAVTPQKELASEAEQLTPRDSTGLPDADRIAQLFNRGEPQLPIVETITYSSRVDWNKGRAAWLVDYARHFKTSRHFIARSLNGRPDYLKQNVNNGDRFNILKPDMDLAFHLVVDISRHRMWFYYHDRDKGERMLLKTYPVGLGRQDPGSSSGLLTPVGTYTLGSRIATFKEKEMGTHQGERVEMVQVFGTRWIPFDSEVTGCSHPAKGFGVHGVPWEYDAASGKYTPRDDTLGHYDSDGCIRLKTEDMEELYAIIVSKPTTIEIVKDFYDAHPPGKEIQG